MGRRSPGRRRFVQASLCAVIMALSIVLLFVQYSVPDVTVSMVYVVKGLSAPVASVEGHPAPPILKQVGNALLRPQALDGHNSGISLLHGALKTAKSNADRHRLISEFFSDMILSADDPGIDSDCVKDNFLDEICLEKSNLGGLVQQLRRLPLSTFFVMVALTTL